MLKKINVKILSRHFPHPTRSGFGLVRSGGPRLGLKLSALHLGNDSMRLDLHLEVVETHEICSSTKAMADCEELLSKIEDQKQ